VFALILNQPMAQENELLVTSLLVQ